MTHREDVEKAGSRRIRRFALIGIVLSGGLAILWGSLSYTHFLGTHKGEAALLTVGAPAHETNALVYIAVDKGYFKRNGLAVTIKEYDSGGAAVPGLLKNEIDLAMASEFVMVNHLLQQHEIRAFGTIDRFENMFLIGRKDRGIEKISDLKHRKVGAPEGTAAAFYIGRWLTLNGLRPGDVTLLNVRPDKSMDALTAADIDAVVTWHPYLDRIIDGYGPGVLVWPIQSSQLAYWNIIGRADVTAAHRSMIQRLLRSISEAEHWASLYPEAAKAVVKTRLGYTDAYIEKVWGDNLFSLSLDQSLIAAMEDEARWLMRHQRVNTSQIPDFVDYIETEWLKAVQPEGVNIIR